jgi:small subunit ribosomal protein S4
VNGKKVDIPSFRVSQWDVIDDQAEVAGHRPVHHRQELVGDRPIPAWLQVVPSSLRILVHQLPERAQIDTQVTEQLIVELYSK